VTFVTDFSVHPAIVSSYIDLNLCITQAAAEESLRLCGRPSVATGPLIPEWFGESDSEERRAELRAELGMPSGVVALVVAGSWGVGNVRATVDLLVAGGITPFVVCGRNDALVVELANRPGVIAVGWRSDMPQLLRACDVVVENAGGLTAMEAMAAGIPVITHETIPGHGRHNAGEMHAAGVTDWVRNPQDLVPTVWDVTCGERGEVQRAAGRSIFAADAAVVVAELARSGDIALALAAAGIAAAERIDPAPTNRLLRTRRRMLTAATALVSMFYLGTTGVAFATDHGVDVADAHRHPHDLYVAVDVTSTEVRSPALAKSLEAVRGAAIISRVVLQSAPSSVRALAADHIAIATGGPNQRGSAALGRSDVDSLPARSELSTITGTRQWLLILDHKLSVVDVCKALLADERIVTPSSVVTAGQPLPRLKGGTVVLVNGAGATTRQLETTLSTLRTEAGSQQLHLQSLVQIAPRPG
jgi:hypothetical protein